MSTQFEHRRNFCTHSAQIILTKFSKSTHMTSTNSVAKMEHARTDSVNIVNHGIQTATFVRNERMARNACGRSFVQNAKLQHSKTADAIISHVLVAVIGATNAGWDSNRQVNATHT